MITKLLILSQLASTILFNFQSSTSSLLLMGEGTFNNPFLISNVDDLLYFEKEVNNGNKFENCFFEQTCDLNLEGKTWRPIGEFATENAFCGQYNGNGYNISNLSFPKNGNNGFFGQLGGTVLNLNIIDSDITGDFIGTFTSHAYQNKAKILNCYAETTLHGIRGGAFADNFNGVIYNCFANCTFDNIEQGKNQIVSYGAQKIDNCFAYKYSNIDVSNSDGIFLYDEAVNKNTIIKKLNRNIYETSISVGVSENNFNKRELFNDNIKVSNDSYNFNFNFLDLYLKNNVGLIIIIGVVGGSLIVLITYSIKSFKKRKLNKD